MQYLYHTDAKADFITLSGDEHRYIFKVRRHRVDEVIALRNLQDDFIYLYKIVHIDKKSASLELQNKELLTIKASKSLHIGWCVIDTKSVEKVLASLCEIGVDKITFISCDKSQRNFKADFKRFDRIVEASMQQSGRTSFIEFASSKNIQTFIKDFPDTKVFDFCENTLENSSGFDTVLVGCEGGFSTNEREILKKQESFRLDSPMVLRSESAVMAVASKILL